MLRNYYLAVLGGPKWFTTKGKVTPFQSLKGINFGLTSGYTLIELIVVISIIGILASFVVVDQVSDEQYDAVRDAVVEADARLRRLAPLRHKLTDIFRSSGK